MELTYKEKTIKYGVYALVILVAAILQNVSGCWFSVFGARCFFLIPTCVLLGVGEDERAAVFMGLFGGILWDMISSQHRLFASVFLVLACYISSALVTFLFRNTYKYGIIASGISTLIFTILYWMIFVLPDGGDGRLYALGSFYIPSMIYTIVMSFLIYLGIRPLKAKLNKSGMSID